jgi:hypothetical protein
MHEYLRRIILSHQKGIIPRASMASAQVSHDDDCGFNHGTECDCDPWIKIECVDRSMYVLKDGTVSTLPV